MRLIDADHLKRWMLRRWQDTDPQNDRPFKAIEILDQIDREDTVQPEIIHCKDCKYYLNDTEKCGLVDTRLQFYETDKTWTEDCFCSWAERRKDD